MYGWIKPQIAIPVHGEDAHMAANAELAKAEGVPRQMLGRNGDLFMLAPQRGIRRAAAPVGRLGLDRDRGHQARGGVDPMDAAVRVRGDHRARNREHRLHLAGGQRAPPGLLAGGDVHCDDRLRPVRGHHDRALVRVQRRVVERSLLQPGRAPQGQRRAVQGRHAAWRDPAAVRREEEPKTFRGRPAPSEEIDPEGLYGGAIPQHPVETTDQPFTGLGLSEPILATVAGLGFEHPTPVQAQVIPVSEKFMDYAQGVQAQLIEAGLRADVNKRDERVGYKIREASLQKIPYALVVGGKESQAGTVNVRSRDRGDQQETTIEGFLSGLEEIRK